MQNLFGRPIGVLVVVLVLAVGLAACNNPAAAPVSTTGFSTTRPTSGSTPPPPVTTTPVSVPSEPVAPDLSGKIVYVTSDMPVQRLWKVGRSGGEAQLMSGATIARQSDHAVSPTGTQIAIETQNNRISILDSEGRKVFESSLRGSEPKWSSDGKWISFAADHKGVAIVEVETGAEWIPSDKHFTGTWSPNAPLLWLHGEKRSSPVLAAPNTRTVTPVDVHAESDNLATWSPTGEVVVTAEATDQLGWVVSTVSTTGSVRRLSRLDSRLWDIVIDPTGTLGAFSVGGNILQTTTRIVDLKSGTVVADLDVGGDMHWSDDGLGIVAPDRSLLATGDGEILAEASFPTGAEAATHTVWKGSTFARFGAGGIWVGQAGEPVERWTDLSTDDLRFSADGGSVVFASLVEDNTEIHLATDSKVTRLTDDPAADASPRFVGPDVLYISDSVGERHIGVLDLASGRQDTMPDTPEPANNIAISPDGSSLAVIASGFAYKVDLVTGDTVELLDGDVPVIAGPGESPTGVAAISQPVWSPDSGEFAVSSSQGVAVLSTENGYRAGVDFIAYQDAYVDMLEANGMGDLDPHNLLPNCPIPISWGSAGGYVFTGPCVGMYPIGLWRVDEIGKAPTLVAGPAYGSSGVDWSPDGRSIAFGHIDISSEVPTVSLLSTDGEELDTILGAFAPQWAPDGSNLAFYRYANDGVGLWVRNGTGRLTQTAARIIEYPISPPVWSPDGRYLAYTAWGQPGILIIDTTDELSEPFALELGPIVAFDWR